MTDNLYERLGLFPECADEITTKDIKKAYRAWMKAHHPDVNDGEGHPEHDAIQEAYDILSNPERRKAYDETGDTGPLPETPEAKAQSWVLMTFAGLLRRPNYESLNLVSELCAQRDRELLAGVNDTMKLQRGIKTLDRTIGRLKAKGSAVFIYTGIEDAKALIEMELAGIEAHKEVLEAVHGILQDVTYDELVGLPGEGGTRRTATPWRY